MFDKNKNMMGIAIGPERIFIVELKRAVGKLEIRKTVNVELPEGVVRDGFITDVKTFSQKLRDALDENNITASLVVAGILGAGVIAREVDLPKMPKEQVKEALRSEVDKYLLSGEEAVLDFYRPNKGKVLFFAIKRTVVSTLLEAMVKAKLNLIGVDLGSLAALRALSHGNVHLTSQNTTAVILRGSEKIDISIVKDGSPVYFRSIESLPSEELAKEIKVTTDYWEDQFPNAPIKKMVLLEDADNGKSVYDKLSEDFDILQRGELSCMMLSDFNLSQSVSVGLAMRGLKEKFNFDINLIPPEKYKKMQYEKRFVISLAVFSAIFFVVFAASILFSKVLGVHEARLERIQKELGSLPEVLSEVRELNAERTYIIKALNHRKEVIRGIEITPWTGILTDIKNAIPSEVWLTEISSKSGKSLELKGKAFTQDAVYKYVHLLEFSEYIYAPKVDVLGRMEEDQSVFRFKIIGSLREE